MALSHPYMAKITVDKFIDRVVQYHGMPYSIISERDLIFVSHFLQEFLKISSTLLKLSLAYQTRIDAQTEMINKCLE